MGVGALLLLADGRFPAGGHAHSAGVEAAVADGRVHDVVTLESFTRGRLLTAGLVDAALAVAAHRAIGRSSSAADTHAALQALDAEAGARISAPPLRAASRKLGRQLVRVASRCWPSPELVAVGGYAATGLHVAVATGVVGAAAGLDADGVARLVLQQVLTTPGQAAVKLLGLDPFEAVALAARLEPEVDDVVAQALAAAEGPIDDLPALTNPLAEIAAIDHGRWDVRLFAT